MGPYLATKIFYFVVQEHERPFLSLHAMTMGLCRYVVCFCSLLPSE